MNPIAERVLALFVSPAAPVEGSAAWDPPVAVRPPSGDDAGTRSLAAWVQVPHSGLSVVLGPSSAVAPVGAALANELRCRARARAALLIVWAPSPVAPVAASPAWPIARRQAERLRVVEPSAVARGRLVRLDLPREPEAAAALIPELVSGDVPAVLVVAGPRPAAFDRVLAAARLVFLVAAADRPPAVIDLAAEELADLASAPSVMAPLSGTVARAVAGAGLGRLRRLPATGAAGQ